jgi:hypothetical protein
MGSLFRFLLLGICAGIIMFPIHALASSRTGAPMGGEGAGLISGWEISNIEYQPSSDPSRIVGVSFDLNSPAKMAAVKLVSADTAYFQCVNYQSYRWQCDLAAGIDLSRMDELRVVASNQ